MKTCSSDCGVIYGAPSSPNIPAYHRVSKPMKTWDWRNQYHWRYTHCPFFLNLYFSIFNCSFSTLFKMHRSLNPDLDRIWLKKLSKRGTNWIIHIKFQIKKKNSNLHFKWVVRRRPICRGAWTVVFVLLQLQPTRLLQALFDVFCEMALFNANKFNPLNYRRVLPVI